MLSLAALESLAAALQQASTVHEKIAVLDQQDVAGHPLRPYFASLSPECELALKQLIAIGQAPEQEISFPLLRDLLVHLAAMDDFYREMGGIAGYQLQVSRLLSKKEQKESAIYHSPSYIDISKRGPDVDQAIELGLEAMPLLAEMYPLGGAADRLHLVDEKTGHELPAAKLQFAGHTLLEGLLRDLEAREYLYFKKTGRTLTVPIAIMLSHEKDNEFHVREILEQRRWFDRPKDSFFLFTQPLVPVVDETGRWRWHSPGKPMLKPGGHGAIWKLAKDHGVFRWFKERGARIALIRQINNPLAGLDYGLLAFLGIGSQGKDFGFASCPRRCLAAEGVNVLIERKSGAKRTFAVSNIEYCDFARRGIEDRPIHPQEPYSRFTSNTNILFANLDALEQAVQRCPFPGLIMNLKQDAEGQSYGRLESTMQNIADVFAEECEELPQKGLKKTFITYNARHKTISTAKKAFKSVANANETPENCFHDQLLAHRELLRESCGFTLPRKKTLEETLASHPPFVFRYHPALGPAFSEIAKKLRRGSLEEGSLIVAELADADIEDLAVNGALRMVAERPFGKERYSRFVSRCVLKEVRVANRGVDWARSLPVWKGEFVFFESLDIVLKGRSEFRAEGVCFEGSHRFVVEDGERLIAQKKNGEFILIRERL